MRPVPVLMYHHVNPHKGDLVTVTPSVFEGQMRHLHESGYRTLRIDELASYISGEIVPNQKAVVVTFDDGWLDNFIYAFPVMRRYSINACVFIVTGWINDSAVSPLPVVPTHKESKALIREGRAGDVILGWDHIKTMQESGLVEFYAHSNSHARCSSLAEQDLMDELARSRQVIEDRLGKPCRYFCWPHGDYNNEAVKAARRIGYKALFTTVRGVVSPGSDPFAVKRISMKDGINWFKKRMLIYTHPFLSAFYLGITKK